MFYRILNYKIANKMNADDGQLEHTREDKRRSFCALLMMVDVKRHGICLCYFHFTAIAHQFFAVGHYCKWKAPSGILSARCSNNFLLHKMSQSLCCAIATSGVGGVWCVHASKRNRTAALRDRWQHNQPSHAAINTFPSQSTRQMFQSNRYACCMHV